MPQGFRFEQYRDDNSSIGALMMAPAQARARALREAGAAQARAAEVSGQATAGAIGNIGNIISGGFQQYAQHQADAPRREAEALQLQGMKDQRAAAEAEAKQSAALRELFARPDPPKQEDIFAIVGPERGIKIVEGLSALQDTGLKRFKSQQEVIAATLAGLDALPEANRAEVYAPIRQNLLSRGLIQPDDAPEQYDPAWFQQARNFGQAPPKAPGTREVKTTDAEGNETIQIVPDTAGQTFTSVKPKEKLTYGTPTPAMVNGRRQFIRAGSDGQLYGTDNKPIPDGAATPIEPQGSSAASEPLHAVIGPNGKPVLLPRSQAVGKTPASGTSKAASGLEKRALNFFNRAQQADTELEGLEPQIQKLNLGGQAWQAVMPNFMQTQLGQSYTAAQRAFTEARLRKDSGAAIPPQEFENDRKTYFAQPGDSNETLEQKRRGRAAILASLGFESGQALSEFLGDADEAAKLLQGYKTRSGKKAADPLGIRK